MLSPSVIKHFFKNILVSPQASIAEINVTIILGLGTIFYDLKSDPIGIQHRVGLFFFLINNQCFRNITFLKLFVAEKELFIHEYISEYYRVSYLLGKLLSHLLTMRILAIILFTCMTSSY